MVLLAGNQVLIRLAMAVRKQVQRGFTVEGLRKELQDAGFEVEVADKLISLAEYQ
jgi:hypothetical protein